MSNQVILLLLQEDSMAQLSDKVFWFGSVCFFLQVEIAQAVKKFTEREESKLKKSLELTN